MGSIMHMGNMKFKQKPREEQAEADGTEGRVASHAVAYFAFVFLFLLQPTTFPTS